jgi:hypothetical protein
MKPRLIDDDHGQSDAEFGGIVDSGEHILATSVRSSHASDAVEINARQIVVSAFISEGDRSDDESKVEY